MKLHKMFVFNVGLYRFITEIGHFRGESPAILSLKVFEMNDSWSDSLLYWIVLFQLKIAKFVFGVTVEIYD